LKKREERLKSGTKKIRWRIWAILQESYKILGMRKLERGVVSRIAPPDI